MIGIDINERSTRPGNASSKIRYLDTALIAIKEIIAIFGV